MELIQEEKIIKKPRRSRQVCEDEAKEYLRRPVQKIQNLTENLMNSYEKNTYLRPKNKNSEQIEKTLAQQQKSSSINQQQNKQSIYHQSNSQKPNQIVQKQKKEILAEMEESSITTSSHQEFQGQQNLSKQSSEPSSKKKKQYKIKDKSSSKSQHQQQQSKKQKYDKDYTPEEQDQKHTNSNIKEESSQMSYKRRRRTQAQMLLAHKIQVLKSFLNKKKYIRKKLRPKKLVGPPLSYQQQWKIDLQKYHKLKQLIKQQMDERKQMIQKIEGFGEQQHLKTIKIEEDILSGKKTRGQHNDDNSQNSRSSSSSSSSSSGNSLSSSKSNNIKPKIQQKSQEQKQKIQETKEKQADDNIDEQDSAEEICKGTEKNISFFRKLVDENLDSLKPKPDRRRRRRRKFVSDHKQYNYPRTKNKNQKTKEQSVKKQEKTIKTESDNLIKSKIKLQTQNKEKNKEQKTNQGLKNEKSNKKIELPPKIHHLRQRRLLQQQKRKVKQHNSQSQPLSQQKRDRLRPKILNKNNLKNIAEGNLSTNKIAYAENSESIIASNPPQVTNQLKNMGNVYAKKSTKFTNETKQIEKNSKIQRNDPQKAKQQYYTQFINDKKKCLTIHSRLVLESMLFRIDKQPSHYTLEKTEDRSKDREKSHKNKKHKHIKEVTESESQSEELDYRNRHKVYDYQPKHSKKNKKYRKIIEQYTDSQHDYHPKPKVYRKVKRSHKQKDDIIQHDLNEHTDQQQKKTSIGEKKRKFKSSHNQR